MGRGILGRILPRIAPYLYGSQEELRKNGQKQLFFTNSQGLEMPNNPLKCNKKLLGRAMEGCLKYF